MAVQTGMAAFGAGAVGVITREDIAKLLLLSIQYTVGANADAGIQVRRMTRRLMPLLTADDRVMLAYETPEQEPWGTLRGELLKGA